VSLDLDGATLAAGARSSTDSAAWAVYLFTRSGEAWIQQDELGPRNGGRFGASLSLDGDVLAVAEPDLSPATGYVHLYLREGTSWSYNGSQNGGGLTTADFGTTVALDGNGLVVGAGGPHIPNGTPGQACFSAYRVDRSPVVPFCHVDISPGLGCAAALDGETALVGACGAAHGAPGSAHVFGRALDDWAYLGEMDVDEGDERYGRSVALDGDTAVVAGDGVVHVFLRSEGAWAPSAELHPDGESGDFGHAVALSGDRVLVGDPEADGGAGAAYVFARSATGWTQQAKLEPNDASGHFGAAVALDGPTAVVSAVNDTHSTITVFSAP